MKSAKKLLGAAGKKLHTHEIHIRRGSDKKGYIARHDLRTSQGQPPQDGQSADAEYPLADKAAMMAHVDQHMGDVEPDEDDQ